MNTSISVFDKTQAANALKDLDSDWQLNRDANAIERRLDFKGYARAVYCANLCAALCDRENHHAEITFGWGYCHLLITTHDAGGLTAMDFELAKKIDIAVAL